MSSPSTRFTPFLGEDTLQALQKTREGISHPDRDAQFLYINRRCQEFQLRGQPVISVDSKKKERVGDFKNGGREWHSKGQPEAVRGHDFPDKPKGKVTPHGVYDMGKNQGWVSVGIDHDTAEFAVDSIRHWWNRMGQPTSWTHTNYRNWCYWHCSPSAWQQPVPSQVPRNWLCAPSVRENFSPGCVQHSGTPPSLMYQGPRFVQQE